MFLAALFIIANIWKQPKCHQIYIHIMHTHTHTHTHIYNSAIRRKKFYHSQNVDRPRDYYAW